MHGMKSDKEYQAESDVRTLTEAGEIKKDKPRYKAAMAKAKKQIADLNYVAMTPKAMGEMSYPKYAAARKSSGNKMNGGYVDHYA